LVFMGSRKDLKWKEKMVKVIALGGKGKLMI
jgi:hypothetical protein